MPDNPPPSFQEIEGVFQTEPAKVLAKLPDNTETRSAQRHLDLAYGYAKESREKVKPEKGES